VDEAQNLTPRAVEELRMLSNFQLEGHALLQSFLVGQPEFRNIMQGEQMQQLRQRVIASYHLGPLDAEETRSYIEHRLAHVGWRKDPMFASGAFEVIYRHTAGIPRRINTLCDRILLSAFLAERHWISETDVEEIVAEQAEEFAAPAVAPGAVAMGNGGGAAALALQLAAIDPTRLQVSGDLVDQVSDMAAKFDVQRIETRIAGLEQSMAATLEVLHHLLQAVRRDTPAGGNVDEA